MADPSSSESSPNFRQLVDRLREGLGGSSGYPVQAHVAPSTDAFVSGRGSRYPPDLREFIRAAGVGFLGVMETLDPSDGQADEAFRVNLEELRREAAFDEYYTEGDPPALNSLVFAVDETTMWIYDTDPERVGRVVVYESNAGDVRISWTAAEDLIGFVGCLAELAERVAFEGNPNSYGRVPRLWPAADWDPDRYRDVLERHGATGAIFGEPWKS